MAQIKNISIPEVCHRSWQQMTAASNGRHCESCCKTVTDFTMMDNDEIINYLAASTNVCGRFYDGQLEQLNKSLNLPKLGYKWWKPFGIAAFAGLLFSSVKVEAQVKKTSPNHNSKFIQSRKPFQNIPIKQDSLYCKPLTPAQINIGAKNKNEIAMELKIAENLSSISSTLGGVSVQGIPIKESGISFYIWWRELFKY